MEFMYKRFRYKELDCEIVNYSEKHDMYVIKRTNNKNESVYSIIDYDDLVKIAIELL